MLLLFDFPIVSFYDMVWMKEINLL